MHKSICALNDPSPGKCDCGHIEREYIAPLIEARKRIAELEIQIGEAFAKGAEAEREACAALAYSHGDERFPENPWSVASSAIATEIRKRYRYNVK